ncbi:hypothetical protein PR003_g28310 [Phytophthora rubi]|uniref:SMP-30/Gluconolactonase/LRE-like region domain-containing protein n=1 Tax=Phytophthora rubi TaxID=129364 RepID=A0A6A4BSU1_9STRA|nr:hypothetical protein PR003_g28310 [Phytophthora rubi]
MQGNAVDSSGNVYVSRLAQLDVVKITPNGTATTFANSSMFTLAMGIAIDSSDNIYITDQHRVLKFTLTGEMSVVAGGTQGSLNGRYAGICGTSGATDGLAANATFEMPVAIAAAPDNVFYVMDGPGRQGLRLRKIYTV